MHDLIGHIQDRTIGQIHTLINVATPQSNNDIWKKMLANEHMENCTIRVRVSSKMVSSLVEDFFFFFFFWESGRGKVLDGRPIGQIHTLINNVTPQSKN